MNFGMHAVGYDPILTDSAARAAGIEPVSLDEVRERGGGGGAGNRATGGDVEATTAAVRVSFGRIIPLRTARKV